MTAKQRNNILISVLLMCPASLFNEIQDGSSPSFTAGFIMSEWTAGLIVSSVISLIIFGLRYLVLKKGSLYTTFYKTTYIICVLIISAHPLGYIFGKIFK
tara:strand:+ start:467 stop:766 length:300 start_codon:yes stop_codon:yes gene_type:complete